jgi:hypothetical protein
MISGWVMFGEIGGGQEEVFEGSVHSIVFLEGFFGVGVL